MLVCSAHDIYCGLPPPGAVLTERGVAYPTTPPLSTKRRFLVCAHFHIHGEPPLRLRRIYFQLFCNASSGSCARVFPLCCHHCLILTFALVSTLPGMAGEGEYSHHCAQTCCGTTVRVRWQAAPLPGGKMADRRPSAARHISAAGYRTCLSTYNRTSFVHLRIAALFGFCACRHREHTEQLGSETLFYRYPAALTPAVLFCPAAKLL